MSGLRDELEHSLEEGVYLLVGLAVLGLQRARARSRQLASATPLERLAGVTAALTEDVVGPACQVLERLRQGIGSRG